MKPIQERPKGIHFFVGDRVQIEPWLPFTTAGMKGEVIRVRRYLFASEVTVKLDGGQTLTVPPCELEWDVG